MNAEPYQFLYCRRLTVRCNIDPNEQKILTRRKHAKNIERVFTGNRMTGSNIVQLVFLVTENFRDHRPVLVDRSLRTSKMFIDTFLYGKNKVGQKMSRLSFTLISSGTRPAFKRRPSSLRRLSSRVLDPQKKCNDARRQPTYVSHESRAITKGIFSY